MGTNVAGAWDKAAKLLHNCCSTKQLGSAETKEALLSVKHLVDRICETPAPRAVWKKLVQQLKVRLGRACVAACTGAHCPFVCNCMV
jgi:hypothetical protein